MACLICKQKGVNYMNSVGHGKMKNETKLITESVEILFAVQRQTSENLRVLYNQLRNFIEYKSL